MAVCTALVRVHILLLDVQSRSVRVVAPHSSLSCRAIIIHLLDLSKLSMMQSLLLIKSVVPFAELVPLAPT